MDFKLILDKNHKEEVVVYSHEISDIVKEIERIVNDVKVEILGYRDKEIVKLSFCDICCFTIENNKLFAITHKGRYQIKERLYQVESLVDNSFIRINQSTLANINNIEKFEATVGGALMIVFKNGYKDYVSRRQLKVVKERLGLK